MKKLKFDTVCTLRKSYVIDVPDELTLHDAAAYANEHLEKSGLNNDFVKEQEDRKPLSFDSGPCNPLLYGPKYVLDPDSCRFDDQPSPYTVFVFYRSSMTGNEFVHEFEYNSLSDDQIDPFKITKYSAKRLTMNMRRIARGSSHLEALYFPVFENTVGEYILSEKHSVFIKLVPMIDVQAFVTLKNYADRDKFNFSPYAIQTKDYDTGMEYSYISRTSDSYWESGGSTITIQQ